MIAQPREEAAGPDDVLGRDAFQEEPVPRMEVELHDPVLDLDEQRLRLELIDVVPRADGPGRLAERGADVLNHEPSFRPAGALPAGAPPAGAPPAGAPPAGAPPAGAPIDAIDTVVARLEVPLVQDQVGDHESLERRGPDEGIVVPGPGPLGLVIRPEPESPGL